MPSSEIGDTPLKIGLDAQPLATSRAGIGRYVLELCRELDARLPDATFYCYSPRPITVALPSLRWIARVDSHPLACRVPSYWWLKARVHRLCAADGVGLFWATRTILPRSGATLRTVTTVHDLNHLLVPASMPTFTRFAHRLFFYHDVRRADAVITNSRGTATRLTAHLGIRANGIARPGVSGAFANQERSDIEARLKRIGVHPPYFLAVGTLEPRKNLSPLIAAFLELCTSHPIAGYRLVIVGQPGWKNAPVTRQLAAADADRVRWLGYVADDDLAALYQAAAAFVMPSLYEGFGIPVLEARASGTRVVASDIPELREAGGPDAVYVTPDKEGIKRGLLRILEDDGPRPSPTSAGWDEAGAVMAEILKKVGHHP
ncbi:MAG: glycosyltransferase family 4 protein [Immundisolibacter sp.]|uniref:glycosyltransferase family 4 protein n=1 Tax=Immundisolibacter sp. TaxID=1934948 RepID=UPI001998432B|nr:glycosyltransferase family 1 protein [Immundisolibacter sp.]MBC7162266.1 glycosyltransferase family 4 protein [Immundisolibacter sp.]